MRNFSTIWWRELTACFLSPIAYVTMVIFLIVSSGSFLYGVFRNVGGTETLSNLLFAAVISWATVLVAVISMRLFAEEKRLGTIETLLTAPVSDAQVVLGKYAGGMTFLLVVLAPAVSSVFLLAAMSPAIGRDEIDIGALCAGTLMTLMSTALFMAMGLLISLLTRNQIVAAICTFCAVWFLLLLGQIIETLPVDLGGLSDYVSIVRHIDDASRGIIDTRPLVYCAASTAFVLFSAIRVLESRTWK